MKQWIYNDEIVDTAPVGAIGFVYKLNNWNSGKIYIGKKQLFTMTKKPLTKAERLAWNKPGRIPAKKVVTKESNWRTYMSSNTAIKEYGNYDHFDRIILKWCYSKKELSYFELKYQFQYGVLETDWSYNDNIAGTYYKKDLIQTTFNKL